MIKWEEAYIIDIPAGTDIDVSGTVIKVKGKLGEAHRDFRDNYVKVEKTENQVKVSVSKNNRRNKGISGTWAAEIKSLMKGVNDGFEYEMKIDYTHFPTRVSVRGKKVVIENFLGERSPREADIVGDSKVNIKGDKVSISGIDKKDIGDTAANIERATKIKGFDLRVFQDGIYIMKGGS